MIATRRGDENRLGFAVQLGTVRFLGIFLPRPTEVPDGVVRFVATQLGIPDLPTSVCAALIADACNIALEPLVRKDTPALTRGCLSWIKQNYFRAETLIQANAALVDCQMTIPLAQHWGGGEVASADPPLGPQPFDGGVHVDGVPGDNGIRDQV